MAQKTTPKQDEIKLIKKLHDMNGYFAAAFCHDDLAVMENNINADYDLLCGTTRDDSVELAALKKRIKDLEEELKATYAGFNEQYRKACDLIAERNQAIDKIKSLEEQGEADEKTIISLQKQICDANHEKEAAIENCLAAQKDNDALQDDLYEKAHECERLRYQIITRDLQLGKELTAAQKELLLQTLEGYED